jgi:hypothetical protein
MVSPDQTLRGATMPSLDDVYRKFGETAEAVQLLETDLGTLLLIARAVDKDLIQKPDSACAEKVLQKINRQTLGQLVKNLKSRDQGFDDLEEVLWRALEERNRLQHSFYRHHNYRRNSDEGRALMLEDLEVIHDAVLKAYKAVNLLSGIDLEAMAAVPHTPPTRRVPI